MLPDWAVVLFAEHAKGKARDDLLITSPMGHRINAVNFGRRNWAKALDESGR